MDADITEEEVEQYDRQIRVWGLDAQKRLRQTRVLVAGLGGLGAEIVKNVVLAGIKSITLLDEKTVSEEDFNYQLLVNPSLIGKNRAVASETRTKELNPNVCVEAVCESLADKGEEFFKQFDVVCLTETPKNLRLKINKICRTNKIKFFCGDIFGYFGYCFADLGMHEYVEKQMIKVEEQEVDGQPGGKRQKLDGNKKENEEEEIVLVKVTDEYCSLEESFTEDWSKRTKRSLRYSSYVFFITQIIDKFYEKNSRLPTREEEDKQLLNVLRSEVLKKAELPEKFIPDDFTDYLISQLNPVCAITGGVLGQEIIKAASQRDATHNNYFFFNGLTNTGIVDTICPPFDE